jgi:hypothetical protein
MVALKLVFPDLIKYMDSKELGERLTYPGLHFFSGITSTASRSAIFLKGLYLLTISIIALILTKNLQRTNVENRLEQAKVDWSKCHLQCHI